MNMFSLYRSGNITFKSKENGKESNILVNIDGGFSSERLSAELQCFRLILSHRQTAPGPPPHLRLLLPALSEPRTTSGEEPWRAFHLHHHRRHHRLKLKPKTETRITFNSTTWKSIKLCNMCVHIRVKAAIHLMFIYFDAPYPTVNPPHLSLGTVVHMKDPSVETKLEHGSPFWPPVPLGFWLIHEWKSHIMSWCNLWKELK